MNQVSEKWALRIASWVWLFSVLVFLLLLGARPARGEVYTVGTLPACTDGSPKALWIVDGSSATDCSTGSGSNDVHCCCTDGSWAACSGASGSGDITDVWGCSTGNCNALTAASGDSLDAGSADSSKPSKRGTSLPGTCAEGDFYHDTDSGGSEVYVCTATNTWTKFATTSTAETDEVAPYGQYDPMNPPSSVGTGGFTEDFTGDATSLSWSWGNQGSSTATLEMDGLTLYTPASATNNLRGYCSTVPSATDFVIYTLLEPEITTSFAVAGIAFLQGTPASPTRIDTLHYRANSAGSADYYAQRWASWTSWTSNHVAYAGANEVVLSTFGMFLRLRYVTSTTTYYPEWSHGGRSWMDFTNGTGYSIAADPDYFCLIIASENVGAAARAHFPFVRLRTDANKNFVGE